MTLAVIVGLWALLLPGSITGESTVPRNPVLMQETTPPQDSQQAPKPSEPPPQSAPAEPATVSQPPEKNSQPPAATKPKKHTHKKKPATQASDPPDKIVIRDGSTTEPNVKLSQPMSQKQTSNQMQKTDDLLAGTESNLQRISGRRLNATQQDTVKQIHQYMDQARKAIGEGDLDRGRNLAFKAHLLSDDLLKH